MENDDIRSVEAHIARELMTLRGETLKSVEEAIGIKAANLSSFLHGKPQVISSQRVALLLNMLGVYGMRLRHDVIHEWRANIGVNALESLLATLGGYPAQERELFMGPMNYENMFAPTRSLALLITSAKKLIAIRIQLEAGLFGDASLEQLPVLFLHETYVAPNQLVATTPSDLKKQLRQHISSTIETHALKELLEFKAEAAMPPDTLRAATKKLTPEERFELGIILGNLLAAGLSAKAICDHLATLKKTDT
ncbi:MAG: helix-turn-helix transcriptional regulator [Moraxellaceae bacterium]|nr:helix-turn-helix transcriptional regulator [Moraxellaceae bacterium]